MLKDLTPHQESKTKLSLKIIIYTLDVQIKPDIV
jgi:hypothetical protein